MPQNQTYRIGELAALSGRSVHTIRWYEAQGLMPGVARDSGGRRVYGELHLGWLELMDRLRTTGMSIAEMREYAALVKKGKGTLKQRHAQLALHRERVKAHIVELSQSVKLIDRKLKFYDEWITVGKQPSPWWPRPKGRAKATKKPNGSGSFGLNQKKPVLVEQLPTLVTSAKSSDAPPARQSEKAGRPRAKNRLPCIPTSSANIVDSVPPPR